MEQLAPITTLNLNDLITQRLKHYITANHLKAGDKLPTEDQFAKQLGVSRTAVREALRSLEALGLVEARQGFGRVVCDFSFEALLNNLSFGVAYSNQSIVNLFEIRKALDAYFIEQALPNITQADIDRMSALVDQMEKHNAAGEPISEEDHQFHQIIYQRCGNPLALQLFEITWMVRMYALDQDKARKEEPPGTVIDHRKIVNAIQKRDLEQSRQLLFDHHWNMQQRYKVWFTQETNPK
jgi:DNA-binding FadR family transcriptional regulator